MKLGYFTMPLHPPGSEWSYTLQKDMQQILLLDELGYDEAWIGEHFTAEWENIPAPDRPATICASTRDPCYNAPSNRAQCRRRARDCQHQEYEFQ